MTARWVETCEISLEDLKPFPGNARRGNIQVIQDSIRHLGQYRALVVRRQGDHLTVLAGNHTREALLAEGHVKARCEVITCDDSEAKRINLVDNRTNDLSTYDEQSLVELLTNLDTFEGTGYDSDDLEEVLASIAQKYNEEQAPGEIKDASKAKAEKRSVSLDLIFSWNAMSLHVLTALEIGWNHGLMSKYADNKSVIDIKEKWPTYPGPLFMDNDWQDYDHDNHLAGISLWNPKYATSRDLLTRAQAEEAEVQYYTFDETMDMAAEINQRCENVIVIPKYDCIEKIPSQYVLGYSVPTSYGGTPLHWSLFKGRRTHLLGGSWLKQRALLNLLKDDICSIDNNYICREADFGCYVSREGKEISRPHGIHQIVGENFPIFRTLALTMSLSAIAAEVHEMFGVDITSHGMFIDDESDAWKFRESQDFVQEVV